MWKTKSAALVALLAVLLLTAGCLGPNNAQGQLAKWNKELDGKWGNEVAFVLLLPVYAVFGVGDLLLFNSWQWWTGHNPISSPADPNPVSG